MHVEVKVGPPALTINQGNMFLVTSEGGEISRHNEEGFFAADTRLISKYRIFLEGQPWLLSTSATDTYYSARLFFLSPELEGAHSHIGKRDLALRLERTIGNGIHEDYQLENYSSRDLDFRLELEIESDFADLFDVKSHTLVVRGEIQSLWDVERAELTTMYRNGDFERGLVCAFRPEQGRAALANGRIAFRIKLPPNGTWRACSLLQPIIDGVRHQPKYGCHEGTQGRTEMDRLQKLWNESRTKIATPAADVQNAYEQSVSDMGALRLYEQDTSERLWMPAAGVPWYVTVFGRDSLISSYQNMLVNCPLAEGTLRRLAELQARARDDYRDAQPGKIMHEIRFGELAHFKLIPHTPYYGTADATILFLILVSETFRWTGREDLLLHYRDTCLRCLEWIDHFGDLDGDGFQEYKTFSPVGYHNMAWKDAADAVVYPDGRIVPQPIAICELQGYVYDAKERMAELLDVLGEKGGAELRRQAQTLKRRFNETFWIEEDGFYAYALDPEKRPVRSVASNAGQLLWSGIIEPGRRATLVVERLLKPDMFSGWGIRTLSSHNPAYNPHDYQRGSIWPHDNGIIAAGCKRYGFWRETNHIARGIFDACSAFVGYRLPELFAGIERTPDAFPVQYLGANIPQAWAAGSVFMFLRAILGIEADAAHNTLWLDPTLPDWLPEITLNHLQVGERRVGIHFSGQGTESRFEVLENEGGLEIRHSPDSRETPASAENRRSA
jgi:glycogen debranching enzyme